MVENFKKEVSQKKDAGDARRAERKLVMKELQHDEEIASKEQLLASENSYMELSTDESTSYEEFSSEEDTASNLTSNTKEISFTKVLKLYVEAEQLYSNKSTQTDGGYKSVVYDCDKGKANSKAKSCKEKTRFENCFQDKADIHRSKNKISKEDLKIIMNLQRKYIFKDLLNGHFGLNSNGNIASSHLVKKFVLTPVNAGKSKLKKEEDDNMHARNKHSNSAAARKKFMASDKLIGGKSNENVRPSTSKRIYSFDRALDARSFGSSDSEECSAFSLVDTRTGQTWRPRNLKRMFLGSNRVSPSDMEPSTKKSKTRRFLSFANKKARRLCKTLRKLCCM